MFFPALKKSFFDLWDHLFFALAVNLVYTLAVLGILSLSFLFQPLGPLGLLVYLPLPFLVASLLGGLATFWARDIVVSGSARFGEVLDHLKASWKPSLAFGAVWMLLLAGWNFGVPFYSELSGWVGIGFAIVLIWLFFFYLGMSLFYPGLNAQVEKRIPKLFRKSLMLFAANPGASFIMFVGLIVSLVLTALTLGLFPGILGISIWLQVWFKFLMAKYEWIEANPEANPKKVPWTVVLADDMEKVGPRSLRSLIFPWKD